MMKNKIMKSILFRDKCFISFLFVLGFLLLFSVSSVSADEYYFNSDNITNESFQGVIDNNTPDEVIINLDDGEYSLGQINITRNATIQGKSSGNVKINGSGILFNIIASNVKLINLTITGYTSAVIGNSSDLTVTGNNITTSGISINISSSGDNLTNISIKDNVIFSSFSNGNYGAVFVNGNGMAISFVFFINNSIRCNDTNNFNGVLVNSKGLRNLTFFGNNITGTDHGVYLNASSSNNTNISFTDNNITGTTFGVYLFAYRSSINTNISFTDNNITGTYYGVVLYVYNSSINTNIIFTDNNITGKSGVDLAAYNSSINTNIIFTNNNITGTSGDGVGLYADSSSINTNITFTDNNITGTYSVSLSATYSINTNISFIDNNITGRDYGVYLNVFNSNNTNISFIDNNITGTSDYGVILNVFRSNNTNISFTNNNITSTSGDGVDLGATYSINTNISFTDNNIIGNNYSVVLHVDSSINTNISFTDNNIIGTDYGVHVRSYDGNVSGVMFLNNTINATGGSGFYFVNHYNVPINVTDFVIRGNTIFANNTGLNFSGLKTGSLVNVTVEYNRIIAPVGVNLNGYDNGSSFDFNWWGVNDITGKTLSINTNNHYILRITNLTSLDNLQSGDNVSFAFLVLNTTLKNDGVENLPYFALNGTFNGNSYDTSRDDSFEDNFTVSSGTQVVAATLDNQYAILAFNTNSSIIVSDVSIGDKAVISGQLSNYTGDGSDLLNVTVDGNVYSDVNINSTGGWSLNYTTNRTGNITVTVNYLGNDNYTSFTNNTNFTVYKNSTNSTINVGNVQIGTNATITGQLEGYTGNGSDLLNVTVDGNVYSDVNINSTGGWSLNYTTNRTGNITVTVNYLGNDNYTSFTNNTNFTVSKNSTNSTINVGNVQIGTNATITGQLANYTVISSVNVTVDGKLYSNVDVDSNGGNWTVNHLTNHTGTYIVTVSYNESDSGNYTSFTNTTTFEVLKNSTNSTILVDDVQVGDTVVITGVLANYTVISSVNVTVDGKLYSNVDVDSNGGNWTVSHLTNHTGTYTVTVSYTESDSGNYTAFTNTTSFAVFKNSTNSTILVDPSSVHVGDTAVITGQLANYTVIGSVNVTVDGKLYSNVVVDSNGGNWTVSHLTNHTGTYTVTVSYTESDSGNYTSFTNTSSFNVLKNSTNSTILVNNVQIGTNASISGTLSDENGNLIVNVNITVTIEGETFSIATNDFGAWNLIYTPHHDGEFFVNVSWIGNDNYTGFTNTTSFNAKLASDSSINIPGTVKFNQAVSISGLLTDQNDNSIADANLELIIDGEAFNVTTDSDGVWSLNYTPKHAGVFDLSLIYLGDDLYDGFIENKTFTVNKLATNSIVNIPTNVKLGETIIISGKAYDENGDPLANIPITVTVNGNVYTLRTDSSGFWSLKYKPTHTGKTSVKVFFNGNSDYLGFINSFSFNVKDNNTNHTNHTNHTNNSNITNGTGNFGFASMKKTGIPVISVVLVLIGIFVVSFRRKQD